jgi:hypothetical protein
MKILESYKDIAKNLLMEEDVMDYEIDYVDSNGEKKKITVRNALRQGGKHPAYKQASDIADKGQHGLAQLKKDKAKDIDPEKPEDEPEDGEDLGKGMDNPSDFERDFDDEENESIHPFKKLLDKIQ